ncbi:hypothetical protein Tco_1081075 [Tanacetum coccineum]|uniref:Uncharacterized protein n=1 Tax=Tanacetum coccineum TaxID=301880 RepID=A0ABQ5HWJ5_9ASTR
MSNVRVNTEESAVKTVPELKRLLLNCNLTIGWAGKDQYINCEDGSTNGPSNQLLQPICVQLTKDWKTLKANPSPVIVTAYLSHFYEEAANSKFEAGTTTSAPRIRPLSPRALEVEMRDVASAYYHSVHPSGTPPVLPIPLPAPSSSRRAEVQEADAPLGRDYYLPLTGLGCEIGESSLL